MECPEAEIKFVRGQVRMLQIEERMPAEIDSLLEEYKRAAEIDQAKEKTNARSVVQSGRAS